MSEVRPPHPLDPLLVLIEMTRENTRMASDCLLAVSALVETLTADRPDLMKRYEAALQASRASSPVERKAQELERRLDETARALRQRMNS